MRRRKSRRRSKRLQASGNRSKKIGAKGKELKHFVMRDDAVEIYCFDEIDSFWGFSAETLIDQLKEVSRDTPIKFFINSYGGEVFEGMSIYNFLRSWEGEVTTICTGIAASVASYLFLVGDKREIYDNAQVMIHNPFFAHVQGDGDDLAKAAETAKRAEEDFVALYASVTGNEPDTVRAWMKDETYFKGQEAVDAGFATALVETPKVVAAEMTLKNLAAKLGKQFPLHKENQMDPKFKAWLEARIKPLGFTVDDLDDDKIKAMKKEYEKQQKASDPPSPAATLSPEDLIARSNEALALNQERIDAINLYAADHSSDKLNEEYLKEIGVKGKTMRALASHAIRNKWSIDKFELEARRSEVPSVGTPGVHIARTEMNANALTASLCRESGIPSRATGGNGEYGVEVWYDEQTLDASDRYRNWSILQVFDAMYAEANGRRYEGRCNTDGFLNAMRDVMHRLRADGNTSWTALNIFDDLANKLLWSAYENQRTTWQEWVAPVSVSDFKTNNMYRLSMTGGYQRVQGDGEIKHGGFTDSKYTVAAETFGKIVGLSRRDLINDDLGALSGVMTALGREGAKFLEEMFYLYLMNNLTTIFPINGNNKNYISGADTALGVDGLTEAETKFANQVDDDEAPLLVDADILLCGTNNSVVASELYKQTSLQVVQGSAPSKTRPDGNPHVSKFRPVVTPYINNTNLKQRSDFIGKSSIGAAIPNQTQTGWGLLPSARAAQGSIVTGAFLNGNQRPVVEQGDPNFDVLGLLWRAYHDAGAGSGDPKLAVWSKGAA